MSKTVSATQVKTEGKAEIAQAAERAQHQIYADHRLRLLDEVDAYRVEKNALVAALGPAVEQLLRSGRPAGDAGDEPRACRLKVEIENLAQREAQVAWRVDRILREAVDAVNKAASTRSVTRETLPPPEVIAAAALLLPLEREGVPLLAGRGSAQATFRHRLVSLLPQSTEEDQLASSTAVDAAFALAGELSPSHIGIVDAVVELRRLREWLAQARAELYRLTRWKWGTRRLEERLLEHPAVVDFEKRWRVQILLDVDSHGHVEMLNIFDDHYPLAYQELTEDVVRRILPRLDRQRERYLIIDRRASFRTYRESLSPLILGDSDVKRYPFTLDLPPHSDVRAELSPEAWRAAHEARVEEDCAIVRHCANSVEPDFTKLTDERIPETARRRAIGEGREVLNSSGGTVTRAWHDEKNRLKGRWEVLKPIVTPIEPVHAAP